MAIQKISMLLIATLMMVPSLSAQAATSNSSSSSSFLTPYSAVYSTVWSKGVTMKVEGKQTLKKAANNQWDFIFTADNFIASIDERVHFKVKDHQILPLHYQYKSSVLGKKRSAELQFDWQEMKVRNNVKNTPWNMTIEPKTIDKLGVQLQVREDLKQGKNVFDYKIADGGHIKNWTFKRDKMEIIKTKLGKVNAIKVTRTDNLDSGKVSSFWFAPKFDYLLVKLVHKEDGQSYKLDIESLKKG